MIKWIGTSALLAILLLASCNLQPLEACELDTPIRVFQATEIDNFMIDSIWVEFPANPQAGSLPGRLFVAKGEPPAVIVPSMIDLPCILSSPEASLELGPVSTAFEFQSNSAFEVSYLWESCPQCRECYMVWSYILTIKGSIQEGGVLAEVSLIHISQHQPSHILSVLLKEATNHCYEPRIACNAQGECSEVYFVGRQ